jgi:aspartate-semialdehyde dehydrogenase
MQSDRQSVGILGATGAVGQRFVQLLAEHPLFRVTWLAAGERSQQQRYCDAASWRLKTPLPEEIAGLPVSAPEPDNAPRIIFSSLHAHVAGELEPRFAAAGCAVITNSSAFRMAGDVPLVIPEVNAGHLDLIEQQSWRRDSGGYIVANPNCCAVGLAVALKPLADAFGIESVFVSTMQAVSGAGYPGVASMDILGNVIPYIAGEEEKLEQETRRLLGTMDGRRITPLDAKITAHCNRVPVEDGHTECVSVKLRAKASREELLAAWREFQPLKKLDLPSAPEFPVQYLPEENRPQPKLDVERDGGMAVTLGRLRPCNLLDWKFTLLSHNTVRGAAGAAILNAELLASLGKLAPLRAAVEIA